ncbi:MAG: hypothetical protein Q9197_002229 [Variospora fuerteventurae]
MVAPETPTKGDDGIQRILADLTAKWDLRFPPQVLQSPAKRNRDRPEEQVLSRIRYLFYHDKNHKQAATADAIKGFEDFAAELLTGWVAKPQADRDVLPTRTRTGTACHHEFLFKKPSLSEEHASDLMQTLLRYLDEAAEGIRKGPIEEESQKDLDPHGLHRETPKNYETQSLRRSSRTSSSKTVRKVRIPSENGDTKPYSSQSDNADLPSPRLQLPSSDDYNVDDSLFDDVKMHDAPQDTTPSKPFSTAIEHNCDAVSLGSQDSDSVEEHYHTPPDSPSKLPKTSSRSHAMQESWAPKKTSGKEGGGSSGSSDTIIPHGRKRSLPASSKRDLPRKMSRDTSQRRSTGISVADSIGGLKYSGNLDFDKVYLESQRPLGSLDKSWSSESISSVTSAGATKSSSALTTPNTSFLSETPATSFDSVAERYELDPLREKPLHGRRSWQNLKEPFGFGLGIEMDVDKRDDAEAMSMGPPAPTSKFRNLPTVSVKDHLAVSPFATADPTKDTSIQLRHLYELSRVATYSNISLQDLLRHFDKASDSYETLWMSMATVAKTYPAALPEKCSPAVWKRSEQGFKGVALTGSLKFLDQPGDRVFDFQIHPLKIEPTYRLARKFGYDRFFILRIPSIDTNDLPCHLQSDSDAREAILEWLLHTEHSFLGRKWRAFYVKPESNRKPGVGSFYRVYLFAESGRDFQAVERPSAVQAAPRLGVATGSEQDPRMFNHLSMTRGELIEWFMPARANREQRALKFFSRLALAVSQTTSSVRFRPDQIIRSDDAFADTPALRRLNPRRSHEKKTKRRPSGKEGRLEKERIVMNDGCARISRRAAKAIADSLNLSYTPSIFQGRIAGAKGVWMVDSLDETIDGPDGDFWIEITDSQSKFEARAEDEYYPDPERVTFEVSSFSRPLMQAKLNFQLMPILAEGGVAFEVFSTLLKDDLTAKVSELEAAMESGLAIRKWNQDVNSVMAERAVHGIQMSGGLPKSLPEKINWFVEHGFEPRDCGRLKDLLYTAIADYCQRLENRMNIGVPKSTYAFMIADPLGILEEGEVHFGFSTPLNDELMLHDIDLLVARLPAALPSDVRKVHAKFKVELRSYHDVIVFPSKGARSLASLLSGGDYDGDQAWVCWEPSIVKPFQNSPLTAAPHSSDYGMKIDTTTVSELLDHDQNRKDVPYPHSLPGTDYISRFLHHGFCFNLRPSLLGICTSYFERFTYAQNSISRGSATKIASLLGYLVDRAKAGLVFDENTWNAFLLHEGLPRSLNKPAYKDREKGTYDRIKGHLIDRLVFETAKGVCERVLHYFSTRFKDVGTYDSDLVALYKNEAAEAKTDAGIAQALKDLERELDGLRDTWAVECARAKETDIEDVSPVKKGRRKSGTMGSSFQARLEQIRDAFLAIKPSQAAMALSPVVDRWARDAFPVAGTTAATSFSSTSSFTAMTPSPPSKHHHWTLLKASYAYYRSHATKLVWYACGVELGVLKSQARGCRNIVDPVWECMKIDGKAVAGHLEMGEGGGGIDGQDREDEYGDWGWVEGLEV